MHQAAQASTLPLKMVLDSTTTSRPSNLVAKPEFQSELVYTLSAFIPTFQEILSPEYL